jgi:hypothetical protein
MSPFHSIACRSAHHQPMKSGRNLRPTNPPSLVPAFPSPPAAPKFPEFLPRERKNEAKTKSATHSHDAPLASRVFPPKTNLISARASDPAFLNSIHPSRRLETRFEEERGKGAAMDAAKSVTPGAVSFVLANPSPKEADNVPELVVQVLDLKSLGATRFT